MTDSRLAARLLFLAILALPVHAAQASVLQPAELLALPVFALAGARVLARRPLPRFTIVDAGVSIWTAAVLFAAASYWLRTGQFAGAVAREAAASLYLGGLYFAIRIAAARTAVEAIAGALVVSFGVAAALGGIGFVASALGWDTPLAFPADTPYPYLGQAARAKALTATPNMLASLLALSLLLLAAGAAPTLSRRTRMLSALLSVLGLALTFSKTAVALLAGLAVVGALSRAREWPLAPAKRVVTACSCLLAALAFLAASHLLLLPEDADRSRLEESMFLAGTPLFRFEIASHRLAAYPTNYYFNKRASAIAVARSWPWGIGPGRHPAFAGRLKREGLYPEAQWLGMPHSSYTGALAEMGLAGGLGLLGFLSALGIGIRRLLERGQGPFAVAAAGFFVTLLIEALATDVMHYRHLTWMAALVALQSRPE